MSEDEFTFRDSSIPDPLQVTYGELLQKVESLREPVMQSAAIGNLLNTLAPEEAVWCLDQLLRGALWGHPSSLETMMATIWWLIEMRVNDEYEQIKDLFMAAHRAQREGVVDLFREVPAHRALPKGRRLPEVRLPLERDVTLGERRAMASGPKRRILERLLMDPSALVIEKLLDNPQIQLQDVLQICSRRPTTPDLLLTVVRHRRWYGRMAVRDAVVRNPFNDTGLSLKLLATIRLKTLRDIAFSSDLHELVHQSAQRLVRLREERTAPWRV